MEPGQYVEPHRYNSARERVHSAATQDYALSYPIVCGATPQEPAFKHRETPTPGETFGIGQST